MVTAIVNVLNQNNHPIRCRSLLDTCSTTNFMTEGLAGTLGLKKMTCRIPIGAVNTLTTFSKSMVLATIRSPINGYERTLSFLIVPHISQTVPDQPINRGAIKIPANLRLADPHFHLPAPVDLLLGAGTTLSLLCVGQLNLSPPEGPDLFLQKTGLGWVIGGNAPCTRPPNSKMCYTINKVPEFDLTRFWEIEEETLTNPFTNEEEKCEEHFEQNSTRDEEGRYVVALPFNDKIRNLGESKTIALKRLMGIERKLSKDPQLKQQYQAVLDEYLSLGHMSPIDDSDSNIHGYYLPHHAVIKQSSLTTKVRVVFDGSAKTSTGISLNETLLVGPTIQPDIFILLIRFRKHPYVLTGDIEKMYRQVLVRPEDRKYQRILWRTESGRIQPYELRTVTFGLAPAPHLAIRSLHQLAEDEGQQFPRATKALREDFYVDDALTGATTREEAIALREELTQLLKRGGFTIRQWASNDTQILENLPKESVNLQISLGESTTLKTLGVFWNSSTDTIVYTVQTTKEPTRVTKRSILSDTARIFDPLGLLAPVIITAKIIMQRLWSLKVDWDESLPLDIHTEWLEYYRQLPTLNNLSFKRAAVPRGAQSIQLHGFCDASQKAYGACIYLRTVDADGKIQAELLCSKSRVAPLKTTTIPRLELCGAVLLASLAARVMNEIQLTTEKCFFWTDSTIVWHWIQSSPHRLKTFVANRVSEIQGKTNTGDWHHVRTYDNPADLVSRGQGPKEFTQPSIWQNGPAWLSQDEDRWPSADSPPIDELPDQRKMTCLVTSNPVDTTILTRYSSFSKLQRVIAYCLRFLRKSKTKGYLSVLELRAAHQTIVRITQQSAFADEIKTLRKKDTLGSSNKLLRLNPFIDEEGVIRVGGRLQHSSLPFSAKHPIILPKNHHITTLIIRNEHWIHFHAGTQATLNAVRQRYWPLDGRSQVWRVVKPCLTCNKTKPPSANYIMGILPKPRITEARPFTHVGVDYCGPFLLKERKYRNRSKIKVYVAVFVCLAVKAVHLEVVSDLTSEGFIAALRRFIGRRGLCTDIYSDNGTNFVGANNELREIYRFINQADQQGEIHTYLAAKGIQWHFIPPQAPNFGGLWEAAVKSFKTHLRRVAGAELIFTFEEFNTLTTEIEAILNSRPLTPISPDANDILVLTPGNFLIGGSLTSLRERDFREITSNRLSTWQHIQKVKQDFWSRWKHDYLNELTIRSKWTHGQHNIREGTLVLLKEDNLPPLQWAMGRVVECHPGSDGIIRTVSVKTPNNILKRSIRKLAPLPIEQSAEQDTNFSLSV